MEITIEIAYNLKKDNLNYILIGERKGKILPGFDYGNSPSQIEKLDFSNKIIIHTTSAGTQGIVNAKYTDEILTGSLVNANAIAKYIKAKNFKEISLVCMGLRGVSQTQEDNLCARYIKDLLENSGTSYMEKEIENLKFTRGAKFFDKEQQSVFPKKDFYLCTEVDKFNFVLRFKKDKDRDYIEKIEI